MKIVDKDLEKVSGGSNSSNERTIGKYKYSGKTSDSELARNDYIYIIKNNCDEAHKGYYHGIYRKPGVFCDGDPCYKLLEEYDDRSGGEENLFKVSDYTLYKTRTKI